MIAQKVASSPLSTALTGCSLLTNMNPAHRIPEIRRDDWVLPNLQHWSDIAYLQWTNPRLQHLPIDLHDVIQCKIENKTTYAVISYILANCEYNEGDESLKSLTWNMETEQAKALLGTPHGCGVAWILIQHKAQLEHKVVDSITLFWNVVGLEDLYDPEQPRSHPYLLFRLKDADDA